MRMNKPDLTGFRKRCKEYQINFNTAYSYKKYHPELSDDQIFEYYLYEKTDFKHLKELCLKEGFNYKTFLNFRRSKEGKKLTEKEQIIVFRQHLLHNKPSIHVGDKRKNTYGLEYEVTAYRSANDFDIRFLIDGTEVQHINSKNYYRGAVGHPVYNRQYFEQKTAEKERLHMKKRMNNGLLAEIIRYHARNDITVRFEDGVEKDTTFGQFLKGTVSHPDLDSYKIQTRKDAQKRIGEEKLNTDGHMMKIICYTDSGDIDIERDDGLIAEHRSYQNFQRGSISFCRHHNCVGERYQANNGLWMEIIASEDKNNHSYVTVRFEDGVVISHRAYDTVKKGEVSHPNLPTQKMFDDFHGFCRIPGSAPVWLGQKRFYPCKCKVCNTEDVLTPQQMIEHAKTHSGLA